jgi:hypothetical protein
MCKKPKCLEDWDRIEHHDDEGHVIYVSYEPNGAAGMGNSVDHDARWPEDPGTGRMAD